MSGDEVFENGQTFTEVGENGPFDNFAVRLRHKTTHTGELTDLVLTASGAGIQHGVNRVDLLSVSFFGFREEGISHLLGGAGPDVDDLVVAFAVGQSTVGVLTVDGIDFFACGSDEFRFCLGYGHIRNGDGEACHGRVFVTEVLQIVQQQDRLVMTDIFIRLSDEFTDLFLLGNAAGKFAVFIRLRHFVPETKDLVPDAVEDTAARGGNDDLAVLVAARGVGAVVRVGDTDRIMDLDVTGFESEEDFIDVAEQSGGFRISRRKSQIVHAQRDVLRRRCDRLAVCGRENVMSSQHEQFTFQLSRRGQGNVNSHLVTVEVSVVPGTDQGVQTDGGTFDQDGVERLNGKSVQGRRTVQHDRVTVGDFFQNVPHHRITAFDHLLRPADRMGIAASLEVTDDEGFKQDQRHLLGQTALVQFQFGTDNDDGTAGVVNTLTEQVLTETALFPFEHVAQRFQRTVADTGDRSAVTAVVHQGVNRFLQHAFFVPDNDFRRAELEQVFQTVVAVDHAAVQVVQVGRGKSAAFQRNQRTQIRRDHRQNFQDHPFGAGVAGDEAFKETQTLGQFSAAGFVLGLCQFSHDLILLRDQIGHLQKRTDRRCTHIRLEGILIFFPCLTVFHFVQGFPQLQRGIARIGNDPVFIVDNAFKRTGSHVQHQTDTAGHTLEEPDVGNGHCQFDVPHPFTTDLCLGNFHTATVTNNTFVLDPFVLAAVTFPVTGGTEDLFAEKTALLRLETSVVDRFRILHFAVTPGADRFRRGDLDHDCFKCAQRLVRLLTRHILAVIIVNHCGFLRVLITLWAVPYA